MLCEYSRTKSECLAEIHASIAEIQNFLQGAVFLIDAPYKACRCVCACMRSCVHSLTFEQITSDLDIFQLDTVYADSEVNSRS